MILNYINKTQVRGGLVYLNFMKYFLSVGKPVKRLSTFASGFNEGDVMKYINK